MTDTWAAKVLAGVPRHADSQGYEPEYILEGDALAALAKLADGDGLEEQRPEVQELIEAYQDIIDYGPVVLARKDQWARLAAAKAKVEVCYTEAKNQEGRTNDR